MMDAERRQRFRELQRELNALKAPEQQERRDARTRDRRDRTKAIGKSADGQREPRQTDATYLKWVRRLCCVACACNGVLNTRRIEAAHIKAGYPGEEGWRWFGKQERSHDWRAVGLCVAHHREGPDAQHNRRETDFWADLNIYPPALCAALQAAYLAGEDGIPVILRFAGINGTVVERSR